MQTFSDDDMRQLLDPGQTIAALEATFRRDYATTVRMPLRTQLQLPSGGVLLVMPCHDSAMAAMGVKLVMVTAQGISATYVLLDAESGVTKAVFEANYLTDVRTAATSGLATKYLAREDATVLGIFGTGRQARAHVAVLPLVRPIERVLVCGTDPARSKNFADEISAHTNVVAEAVDPATCTATADVICTCTTACQPIIEGARIRPGTHLNLIGAFRPQTREVDSETIRRAWVVVDTYEGALAEAGDILIPLREGCITRSHIAADLHEVVSRKKPGRTSRRQITVFKSLGCAIEDLVAARLALERAEQVP